MFKKGDSVWAWVEDQWIDATVVKHYPKTRKAKIMYAVKTRIGYKTERVFHYVTVPDWYVQMVMEALELPASKVTIKRRKTTRVLSEYQAAKQ